jgi:threonine dehydratase
LVTIQEIVQARESIGKFIRVTPLRYSNYLSELTGAAIYLKLENEQVTGSFKLRGALNKMMSLSREEKQRDVITASTGNHGLGVAFAAKELGITAHVVFPTEASANKREKLAKAGVDVIQEVGYADIERFARSIAQERNMIYVSPYNDSAVIAGAGTVGIELLEQSEHADVVIVPIGGGGLISGISIAVKAKSPATKIIGVQSEVSPEVHDSWKAGHWVHAIESESLAQGLMGGVEPNSITLDIIQENVDDIHLVRESSLLAAMGILYEKESLVIEGAGAASVADLIEKEHQFSGKTVVAVISGGNISEQSLTSLLSKQESKPTG